MQYQPKGGRGNTAPYETKQIRVPVPLESQIKELIGRYRQWLSGEVFADSPPRLLDLAPVKSIAKVGEGKTNPITTPNLSTKKGALKDKWQQELEDKYRGADGFCRVKKSDGSSFLFSGTLGEVSKKYNTCTLFDSLTDTRIKVDIDRLILPETKAVKKLKKEKI